MQPDVCSPWVFVYVPVTMPIALCRSRAGERYGCILLFAAHGILYMSLLRCRPTSWLLSFTSKNVAKCVSCIPQRVQKTYVRYEQEVNAERAACHVFFYTIRVIWPRFADLSRSYWPVAAVSNHYSPARQSNQAQGAWSYNLCYGTSIRQTFEKRLPDGSLAVCGIFRLHYRWQGE
jgi:hypothetical protein